jgi:hypothetical protein
MSQDDTWFRSGVLEERNMKLLAVVPRALRVSRPIS